MNNYNPNQFQQPNYGYQYAQQQVPVIQWTNPLDAEGERLLKEKAPEFNLLEVSKEESLRASCTHRDPASRSLTLQPLGNGSYRCTKCGSELNIVTGIDEAEAERHVNGIIDLLQTAKMFYLDMPPASVVGYFQMIPFLEKLPRLLKIAQDTFNKSDAGAAIQGQYQTGNPWANLQQAVASPFNGVPGADYTQPWANQQPVQMQPPVQGMPGQVPQGNVFQQGTPVSPYNYQQPVYQQPVYQQPYGQPPVPQAQAPQAQATDNNQPSGDDKVTTKKTFEV